MRSLERSVLYQVYPPSFADGDGDGVGDLPGIVERLDHLRWLGVDLVWLSPCFTSPFADGGYDISDYFTVAPRYGGNAALVELVEQAGRRGIGVVLDLVVGHTSDQHPLFRAAANDPADERFIWAPRPAGPRWVVGPGGRFFLSNFLPCQPALNFGFARPDPDEPWRQAPDAPGPRANRAMIRDIMRHFLDLGVAGFRCDMAYSLVKDDPGQVATGAVWREVRAFLDRDYPRALMLSEWGQPVVASRAGFHADFFLHFNGPELRSLWDDRSGTVRDPAEVAAPPLLDPAGRGSLATFVAGWQAAHDAGATVILPTANHDFTRLAGTSRGPEELKAAFALLLTLPVVPAIYYGDEIGLRFQPDAPTVEGAGLGPGNNRAGSRTPMQWDDSPNAGFSTADRLYLPTDPDPHRPTVAAQRDDPTSLLHTVRDLIELRAQHPGLGPTASFDLLSAANPVAYLRAGDYLVVVNPTAHPVNLTGWDHAQPLLTHRCHLDNGRISLTAHGFGIFRQPTTTEGDQANDIQAEVPRAVCNYPTGTTRATFTGTWVQGHLVSFRFGGDGTVLRWGAPPGWATTRDRGLSSAPTT